MNIPNLFTATRILLTIAVAGLMLQGETSGKLIAGVLLIIAWATDGLDGFLARKLGQCTLTGALFDLIADRVLMDTVLVLSVVLGYWEQATGLMPFNPFPYAGTVLAADLALWVGIIVFVHKTRVRALAFPEPTMVVKMTFLIQMATLIVSVLGINQSGVLAAMMYLSIIMTLIAFYSYIKKGGYIFTE